MSKYRDPMDEPTGEPVSAFDLDYELFSLKTSEYKELLLEEIQLYHSEPAYQQYLAQKAANPKGILHQKFGKERLKTMQKMDDKIVKGFYPSTDPADKQF
jgi:hypothetical protein